MILIGGGGHARVLKSVIEAMGEGEGEIIGYTDHHPTTLSLPYLGSDDVIREYGVDKTALVNGVGSSGLPLLRQAVFLKFKRLGYVFRTLIHPSAMVAPDAVVSEGAQIMPGAIINTGAVIGENAIINTGSIAEHDCKISAHVHIAPGVLLSGNVYVGRGVHIGLGARVIQNIKIGDETIIGAGAVVIRDLPASCRALGVPARVTR